MPCGRRIFPLILALFINNLNKVTHLYQLLILAYEVNLFRKLYSILYNLLTIGVHFITCNVIKDLNKSFDSQLKFRKHIDNINCKALKILEFMKRVFMNFKFNSYLKLLYIFFLVHL